MILLAVDTALDACAAAVLIEADGERRLFAASEVIGRGHAERLMAVVGEATERAGIGLDAVEAFAVTIGPGSFTGIRVGVAAVRGFALATGRPAIGIGTLPALALEARALAPGRAVTAVIDARKDEVYAQSFAADGRPLDAAVVIGRAAAAERARALDTVVIGSGAPLLAALDPGLEIAAATPFPAIATIADLAAAALAAGGPPRPPSPLYVRAPDAKPQAGHRLARLMPTALDGDREEAGP